MKNSSQSRAFIFCVLFTNSAFGFFVYWVFLFFFLPRVHFSASQRFVTWDQPKHSNISAPNGAEASKFLSSAFLFFFFLSKKLIGSVSLHIADWIFKSARCSLTSLNSASFIFFLTQSHPKDGFYVIFCDYPNQ